MVTRVDLTGQKFNHLTAICFSHVRPKYRNIWKFRCDCGADYFAEQYAVKTGGLKSCGCVNGIHVSDPITRDQAAAVFAYDPETGIIKWKVETHMCAPGQVAGYLTRGYVEITFRDKRYLAHHLIWLLVYGRLPEADVDHRDLCRSNNRLENLRDATRTQNNGNLRKRASNTSGFKGVTAHGRKWVARIGRDWKHHYIGIFSTPEEAAIAYDAKAVELFGDFARTNFGEHRA